MLRSKAEELVRKSMANFVDNEIIPRAQYFDEQGEIPREIFLELGKMGVLC